MIETTSLPKVPRVFSRDALLLDAPREVERITAFLTDTIHNTLHRKGAVVGLSGGIDSSLVMALCVKALGTEKVLGVLMPERESSPASAELAHLLADKFGVETVTEDLTGALEGFGCYQRRDEAIKTVVPEYGPGWKARIALPGTLLEAGTLNVFSLKVIDPQGNETSHRLPPKPLAQIVAASNFKQRSRMAMVYYHAERLNYVVAGTSQKDEHELGFYVKYGDGGSDVNPIQHLFKCQVFQLARYLGVPEEIAKRKTTTDTYPGGGSQEEFFYRIPFETLDLIWLGIEQGVLREEIAAVLGLTVEQVGWVEEDIARKKRATEWLRLEPVVMEK